MIVWFKILLCVFLVLFVAVGHVGCVTLDKTPTMPLEVIESSATATEPSQAIITEDFEYTICDGEVTILNVLTTESNVVVPETIEGCPVTVIGENAFYQKANCVSVELPDSLRRIENGAFYRCSNLQRICIPAGVTFVGDDAFFRTGSLERIEVQTGNAAYCAVDGVLFSANKTTLVCYPEGRTATEYIVPEEVLTIGADAFGYHPLVRRIVIPNTVVNFPEGPLAAITEELTIVGERDSSAEAYAQKWEIAFE